MTLAQQIITIGVAVLGTMMTRFLPFFLFPDNKETPKYIKYLGTVLPYSVIGLLVIYCLKDVRFSGYPFGLAELLSIICIIFLHCWKRNMFISIGMGTIIYMILVQVVI